MVSQLLTEKDILDYLMTSDFNEGLTQEESKFLLLKYRSFYRVEHARYENSLNIICDLEKSLSRKDSEAKEATEKLNKISTELEVEKARKLTFKERFFGIKIIKE